MGSSGYNCEEHEVLKSRIEAVVKESEALKEALQYTSFVDLLGKKSVFSEMYKNNQADDN